LPEINIDKPDRITESEAELQGRVPLLVPETAAFLIGLVFAWKRCLNWEYELDAQLAEAPRGLKTVLPHSYNHT